MSTTTMYPDFPPRLTESFRIVVGHPSSPGKRLITGEWLMQSMWSLVVGDHVPLLAKAGPVTIVASTAPQDAHGREGRRAWYGDPDWPVLYWRWEPGATDWVWPAEEQLQAYAAAHKLPVELLRLPAGQPVPWAMQQAVRALRIATA